MGRNREKDGWKRIRLTLRTAVRRERKNRLSSPCISSLCVMAQRGGNTEVGTWYPLGPVPIPSTAITYNNDGLMEPVGDLTLARKREKKTPRGRYEGVHIYTDMEKALYLFFLFLSLSFFILLPLFILRPFSFSFSLTVLLSIDFPLIVWLKRIERESLSEWGNENRWILPQSVREILYGIVNFL